MMQATASEAEQTVREYQKFMNRINHPSKNMIYAMSKAIFFKYDLNEFQDEYFSRMQVPNPLFLKRMDAVVGNFLWDWDAFFKKYRIDDWPYRTIIDNTTSNDCSITLISFYTLHTRYRNSGSHPETGSLRPITSFPGAEKLYPEVFQSDYTCYHSRVPKMK